MIQKIFLMISLLSMRILSINTTEYDNQSYALVVDDFGKIHNVTLAPNFISQRIRRGKPEFRLYTRNSPSMQFLQADATSLLESSFDFNRKTWIYTHGWLGNGLEPRAMAIKEAYLWMWDVNVIILDWSIVAGNLYYHARYGMEEMAAELTILLKFLSDSGYSLSNVNMVGHSLGAHLVGLASKQLKKETVGTITGLDPALLYFQLSNPEGRLSDTDASYVEIIHSNAGIAGFLDPIGHVDIYVNSGVLQIECGIQVFACPHFRSINVYERSIKNPLMAVRCESLSAALQRRCSASEYSHRIGGNLPKEWVKGIYSYSTA